MDIYICLLIIAILYGVLYFFDVFFKTCSLYPYIQFLKGTGLEIKFLHIYWNTTAFNRLLVRWGSSNTRFFNVWFNVGLFATLILLPIAILLLLTATFQILFQNKQEGQTIIEPIIPGVNLPATELGYYAATLIICSVIHELGHAIASVKEDVHVVNVGMMIFFILPLAYVNISSDKLATLNPWRALKILCAGVWHNLVLAFVAYLLYLGAPHILSLFFYVNNGISVKHIEIDSPLSGTRGLFVGDTITKINDCVVSDEISWKECLWQTQFNKPGFCVNADLVHLLDESIPLTQLANGAVDCCEQDRTENLCFEYLDMDDGVLEMPPHLCLPARKIIESSNFYCSQSVQKCSNNLHCIRPVLHNSTSLMKIKRLHKSDIIYIGHPSDIFRTVQASSFVPKYFFKTTTIADVVMREFEYLVLFSLGLAIVNVIPCFFMDGHHITNSLVRIILLDYFKWREPVKLTSFIITVFGTLLLIFLCINAVCKEFLRNL